MSFERSSECHFQPYQDCIELTNLVLPLELECSFYCIPQAASQVADSLAKRGAKC